MIVIRLSPDTQFSAHAARTLSKTLTALAALLICIAAAQAQAQVPDDHPGDPQARVIDGVSNSTVFGLGQSIRITGPVRQGAIVFGGDVIVEGTVDGVLKAIGGSAYHM